MGDEKDRPLNRDEIALLEAVRDVWCGQNGVAEMAGEWQQVLINLIDWYQLGYQQIEELYLMLDAEASKRRFL